MSSKTAPALLRCVLAVLPLSVLAACPDGIDVENRTFPCRAPEDCVDGYVCHPTRWVCVAADQVDCPTDGGTLDGCD